MRVIVCVGGVGAFRAAVPQGHTRVSGEVRSRKLPHHCPRTYLSMVSADSSGRIESDCVLCLIIVCPGGMARP